MKYLYENDALKAAVELFVVEYSVARDDWHIQTFGGMLEGNKESLLAENYDGLEYIPIAVFMTSEQAVKFIKEFKKIIKTKGFKQRSDAYRI